MNSTSAPLLESVESCQAEASSYSDEPKNSSEFCDEEESNADSLFLDDKETEQSEPCLSVAPRTARSPLITSLRSISASLVSVLIQLQFLLPSFIINIWQPHEPKKLSPTAYLNGVRGVAAYSVFWQHFMTEFYSTETNWGWHTRPPPHDRWLIQLPFISLTHSGFFPVTTFFILSGFVLSYGPLRHVRSQNFERLLQNLSSSVLRRGARLFLPCVTPLLFAALCIYADTYRGRFFFGSRKPTLGENLKDAWWYWEGLVNFMNTGFRPPSDAPLYTLPVEFQGSILVFLCVLALSRVTPWIRMTLLACLAYYCMSKAAWEMFLFITGIVLAELRHIREASEYSFESLFQGKEGPRYARRIINTSWILLFITSLYTASIPVMGSLSAPGFQTLASWAPLPFQASDHLRAAFWCSTSSILLLLCLENFPPLQRPFASKPVQYLGDISFSLYVFHVPIILSIGRPLIDSIMGRWAAAGWDPSWGWMIGGYFVVTPILVWVSDIQWRFVDEGSVKFARWIEDLITAK